MELNDRLRLCLDEKSLTIRAFSELCGLPYRSAQDYVSGKTSPGAEALRKIATGLRISLDYLVLGHEDRSPSHGAGSFRGNRGVKVSGLDEALAIQAHRVEEDLALGEIAALAQLGTAGATWRVMEALLHAPIGGLTIQELARALSWSSNELSPHLVLLRQIGLIEEGVGLRIKLALPVGQFQAQTLPDKHQVALAAAKLVLTRILPAQVQGAGRVELLEARVGQGKAAKYAKEVSRVLASIAERASSESDEDEAETLTVVFGVAAETDQS